MASRMFSTAEVVSLIMDDMSPLLKGVMKNMFA